MGDIQSRITWLTGNKRSKTKSTSRAKLKSTSQEERIHIWKEHFKKLLGKSPKVTNKAITKFINNQLDIKQELFTQEKLGVVRRKIKNRKADFGEISPELWKTKKIDNLRLQN